MMHVRMKNTGVRVCAVPVFRHESGEPHYAVFHGIVCALANHSAEESHFASMLVHQFGALASEIQSGNLWRREKEGGCRFMRETDGVTENGSTC